MKLRPTKSQLLRLLPDALVLTRGPRHGDAVYLSFDDGPHPEHTPRLLDLLAAHGSRASFFLVGQRIEQHPQLVERIVAEGHTLGNHSYSHPLFNVLNLHQQLVEIERTDRLLQTFDGHARHRFRPPHGSLSLPLLLHFARHGRGMAYWSYNSLDYQPRSTDELVRHLRNEPPRAGDIILLHDDNGRACEVLGTLLPEWMIAGRRSEALPPELA
jgi:peptidoglycan-N-acetylglucosamine deacetylase